MLPFKKKSTPIIGVDISATAIKLLELSRSGGQYRVESYAVEPLPQNSVADKNINDIDAVGEAIGRAVNQDSQGAAVGNIPVINTKSLTTQVLVDDGETVVLGGVYNEVEKSSSDRVPFFGDLPGVGFLFKRNFVDRSRSELLIFITLKILKEELDI